MALKAFSRQIMFELYKTDLKFFNENFGTNKIIEEWSSDDAMVGWGVAGSFVQAAKVDLVDQEATALLRPRF